jgi:hypothetical protein
VSFPLSSDACADCAFHSNCPRPSHFFCLGHSLFLE